MKKFAKFCLITALVLILLSIVFGAAACSAGATRVTAQSVRGIMNGNFDLLDILGYWEDDGEYSEEGETNSFSFAASEGIKTIQVDLKCADIDIYSASDYSGDVQEGEIIVEKKIYNKNQAIDISAENGKLKIEETKTEKKLINLAGKGTRIEIYLPDMLELEEVNIQSGAGNISVENDLRVKHLKMDNSVGNIEIPSELFAQEDVDVSVGTGNIKLENIICAGNLSMKSGVGNVEAVGTVTGDLDAGTGTGNVTLELSGEAQDYNYKLKTATGEVIINGEKYEKVSNEVHYENKYNSSMIKVESGVGDIDITIAGDLHL